MGRPAAPVLLCSAGRWVCVGRVVVVVFVSFLSNTLAPLCSFAGGTTDGPGAFDFKQGGSNPFWNWIASFLSDPSAEQKQCQSPKPILLNVGEITFPVPWAPNILPFQIFRIGNLFILGIPGAAGIYMHSLLDYVFDVSHKYISSP